MLAHARAHTYALTILHFTAFDGTTSPHLSSESCHVWLQKRATQQPHQISLLSWPWDTHMMCVCTPVSDMKGRRVFRHRCAALSICPLFFCLQLVPWNLTGALLFIHFILFVCSLSLSLSLCMCVCQLLYRPTAYSDHSRPRYAQTGDGEGIQ